MLSLRSTRAIKAWQGHYELVLRADGVDAFQDIVHHLLVHHLVAVVAHHAVEVVSKSGFPSASQVSCCHILRL